MQTAGPAVDFVVIGAMKAGTTSLHHYLSCHEQLALAPEKEVNFFFGEAPGGPGNHWRGASWYRSRFPRHGALRGDVSPAYTSPDHPGVARRIADVAPDAKLLYLVRDPLDRAVSQYRHHRRDGTEPRPPEAALLDPDGHYLLRSRYAARLRPFLEHFPPRRIAVVDHEDLRDRTPETVASVCGFLGVTAMRSPGALDRRLNGAGSSPPPIPAGLARSFRSLVADDAATFIEVRRSLHHCAPGG